MWGLSGGSAGLADYELATDGLGQNAGYLGQYSTMAAFVFEVVATFLFMVVIPGSTGATAPSAMAGLAIGLALVVIHLVGINVTGLSVNPARLVGPALLWVARRYHSFGCSSSRRFLVPWPLSGSGLLEPSN